MKDKTHIMIGDNLKRLRLKSNRTLEDVAEIIDVSRQSVSKWESGKSYPDIEKCVKLSKLYNVSLDALVNKSVEDLLNEQAKDNKYMFGLTKLSSDGTVKLPTGAIDVFELETNDTLLVVGDKSRGIAMVKCGGINDSIDNGNNKEE